MTLFSLLYDLGLHLYACACLPKIATHFRKKYRGSLLQRLGRNFPSIEKQGRKLIWIHAVSLGETKAVAALIKRLKSIENPPLILLSTTTHTGHAEGHKSAPMADFHLYLPFDFSYVIRPIIQRTAPDLVLLTETDFWYHFQEAVKKRGGKVILINGKISERSFTRFSKLPFFTKRLLGTIDHFYLQGELYRSRFAQLQIPPSKLTITGNLKLDSEIETEDLSRLKRELGLTNQTVLTLGSTHDPEERIWLRALKQLWTHFPQLKVMIVPRHPERFSQVAKLLHLEGVKFSQWSQGGTFHTHPILLVDAMGVLRKCYQISDLTFVGGSFTPKIGGHNILEPAFYGKPVLFGPHMHAQPDLLDLVTTHQAGLQLSEETLLSTLHHLLSNPPLYQQLGTNGEKLLSSSRGALDQTFQALQSLLQKQSS
jgi:3-deoxy-D-manno-octulosonic-acid transferase